MIKVTLEYKSMEQDKEILSWVFEHCQSTVTREYIDMSDISSWKGPDDLMEYHFNCEEDAILFKLRWEQ